MTPQEPQAPRTTSSPPPINDRREQSRYLPCGPISVHRTLPVLPLSDAEVLNVSAQGVALRSRVAVLPDERLSFTTGAGTPPILAKVIACEPLEEGGFRIRCQCLLGEFELI